MNYSKTDDPSIVIGDNGQPYAATRLPETGWQFAEAWSILDCVSPGVVPTPARLLLAGLIAGALGRAAATPSPVSKADEADGDAVANEVQELVAQIGKLLRGRNPTVQSAALADLLAMFIAGHVVFGDRRATTKARAAVLGEHMKLVRDLIGPNEERIGTAKLAREKTQ